MKVTETKSIAVNFNNSVYTNTYVSNYNGGETEFKFSDYRDDGSEYKLNINVPIDTARAILAELQQDIENYDAFIAKQAKEKTEEEAAKKAEESQESDS
tara:strand:+ start:2383 stop:2679 length:297 start_codon:yes stop_codon:yes gene_type:complete